jgi:Icc-related predicted phosphoesterase
MIIDCISDLHGHYPELPGGDLLIVAGDLTRRDTIPELKEFYDWLKAQDYRKKVHIGGNHDNFLQECLSSQKAEELGLSENEGFDYLCDSGTEFEGLKIWGSPWTKRFEGMNPNCMAFMVETEEELREKWKLIPNDIDILVTHCPPKGIFDEVNHRGESKNIGSASLLVKGLVLPDLKLHIFGHIHENGGSIKGSRPEEEIRLARCNRRVIYVNASYVNERYQPVNKHVRIKLP